MRDGEGFPVLDGLMLMSAQFQYSSYRQRTQGRARICAWSSNMESNSCLPDMLWFCHRFLGRLGHRCHLASGWGYDHFVGRRSLS